MKIVLLQMSQSVIDTCSACDASRDPTVFFWHKWSSTLIQFVYFKEVHIDVFTSALVVWPGFGDTFSVILELLLQAKLISEPVF